MYVESRSGAKINLVLNHGWLVLIKNLEDFARCASNGYYFLASYSHEIRSVEFIVWGTSVGELFLNMKLMALSLLQVSVNVQYGLNDRKTPVVCFTLPAKITT